MQVEVEHLLRYLGADLNGHAEDAAIAPHAWRHLVAVTETVKGYTRGRGFTDGMPSEDIAAVILTAAARSMTSPDGRTHEAAADGSSVRHTPFAGFTLAEQAVLNRYRRRAVLNVPSLHRLDAAVERNEGARCEPAQIEVPGSHRTRSARPRRRFEFSRCRMSPRT